MDPISLVQAEVDNICKTFGPFNSIWDALHKILKYYETKKISAPDSVIKHAVRMSYRKLTYDRANETFKLKIMIRGKRVKDGVRIAKPILKFLYKLLVFCRDNRQLELEETYYTLAKYVVGYVGGSTYANVKRYLEYLSNVVIVDTINKTDIKILSAELQDNKAKIQVTPEFYSLVEYMNFDFKEFLLFFQASARKKSKFRKEE